MKMDRLGIICAIVVALMLFVERTDAQDCSTFSNCTDCLLNECSWCRELLSGSLPRCMDKRELGPLGCTQYVPQGMSGLLIHVNLPDKLIAPQQIKMNIEYGTPMIAYLDIQIPKYAGRKNKLLLKYKALNGYDQMLITKGVRGRSFKKRNVHYFLMKNVEPNSTMQIRYKISATYCEKIKHKKAVMVARFVEKGKKTIKEKLKVVLKKLNCPCDCPYFQYFDYMVQVQYHEVDSVKCSGRGTSECGVCRCNEGYSGTFCELSVLSDLELQCIDPNGTKVCSGRGECIEGYCACHPRQSNSVRKYSGQFCQCDDYSCSYSNNMMCGGPDRGQCFCGVCSCSEGYIGDACDCPTSGATCMASNGEVCNGQGECECGTCRCFAESLYKGPTCEECPTCPGKCHEIRHCVQCWMFADGPLTKEECMERCSEYNIMGVEVLEPSENTRLCQFKSENDCIYMFDYNYDYYITSTKVRAQYVKECPYK